MILAPVGSQLKPNGPFGAARLEIPTDGDPLTLGAADAMEAAQAGRHGLKWQEN